VKIINKCISHQITRFESLFLRISDLGSALKVPWNPHEAFSVCSLKYPRFPLAVTPIEKKQFTITMKVESLVSNISTIFFVYILSYYSLRGYEKEFYGVLALFVVGITCLVWSWATCQLIGLIRYGSLALLAYQLYEIQDSHPLQLLDLVAFLISLYLVAYNQYTAQKISSFKTVFLDW
jgi:hypothetical protein